MVATRLAANSLLAVAGIAGNWIWWSGAMGSMLSVPFFARLWRRAGILTNVAFVELRYGGLAAAWLRASGRSISVSRLTASSSNGSIWRWTRS